MAPGVPPIGLRGRDREAATLMELLEDVRGGQSRVLLVRGEPGIGKSALLDHLVGAATGIRVLRAVGVEGEMELPFAALHQLCSPVLDRLSSLPEPQHEALAQVFGLRGGGPPDRLLVGLGTLSLLAGLGAERPLLCVVDDAQWLDQASAQAMSFVARRLLADPVGLVFASRSSLPHLAQLPELTLGGIDDRHASALLQAVRPMMLDPEVQRRVVAEAGGNPLALLELTRDSAMLAVGRRTQQPQAVLALLEESFRRRLDELPPDTRQLLVVAAAEPVGDPVVVLRAARTLGIEPHAARPAEDAGLIEMGVRIRFRHPLVRWAAYSSAESATRVEAHRALAIATDAAVDPDRRAWHLAQATTLPTEPVAVELERSAARAQSRGGYAAAAAFLGRSVALSTDPTVRARRALAAAQFEHLAGAHGAALEMLVVAESGPLDERERAQADLLRAEVAYIERRGNDAPDLLVRAAQRLEPVDPAMARATYLDALVATNFAGRLAVPTGLREAAIAARGGPPAADPPSASDVLLDGLAAIPIDGYAAAVPTLQRAVAAFRGEGVTMAEQLRWLWPAAHVSMSVWDDESYEELSALHIELARGAGLLAVLPTALTTRAVACAFTGRLDESDRLMRELHLLTEALDVPMPSYAPLFVAGWRGRQEPAMRLISAARDDNSDRGEGAALAFAGYATAVLNNGLGRYDEALAAATWIESFEHDGIPIASAGMPELIEAAVRAGDLSTAHDVLERLSSATTAAGTDWALGVQAVSQALLAPGASAAELYEEAIERLGRTRIRPRQARAHLVYGEWLRREGRRVDARRHLRDAFEMFGAMGMEAFAERARRELLATGETVRKRTAPTITELTAQEAHIARLAVDGHTNPEIGAQLFISARTVEWHLRKVFTKLGISSRRELRAALARHGELSALL